MYTLKKTQLLAAVFILAILGTASAQNNYVAGYVIKNNFDTLKGFINHTETYKNPTFIEFKYNLNGPSIKFNITDLTYVNIFNTGIYQRTVVSISMNSVSLNQFHSDLDRTTITDTVLLKVLETGNKITLYSYVDNLKQRFYVSINSTQTPTELFYGIRRSQLVRSYVNQLIMIATQNNFLTEKLKREISKANYTELAITDIARKMNGNEKEEKKKQNTREHFYLGLGADIGTFFYEGSVDLAKAPTKNYSISPYLIFGSDLFSNPKLHRLAIRAELLILLATYKTSSVEKYLDVTTFTQKLSIVNPSLGINALYRIYQKNNFRLVMGAGGRVSTPLKLNNTYTVKTQHSNSTSSTFTTNDYGKINQFSVAYLFKVGAIIKKIELYATYVGKSAIIGINDSSGYIQSVQIGVNYHFGKGRSTY